MLVVLPDRIRRATLVNGVWFVMIFHSARQISVGKGNDMEFGVQVNVYRTNWDAVKASVEAMEAIGTVFGLRIISFRRERTTSRKLSLHSRDCRPSRLLVA